MPPAPRPDTISYGPRRAPEVRFITGVSIRCQRSESTKTKSSCGGDRLIRAKASSTLQSARRRPSRLTSDSLVPSEVEGRWGKDEPGDLDCGDGAARAAA